MKYHILLCCLCVAIQLSAQSAADCNTAFQICNKQPLHIPGVSGAGADQTELNDAICFANGVQSNVEYNSYWIRFTAAENGSLYFVITPDSSFDDLDFVFYQLQSNGSCEQKQVLRCMAAGLSSVGSNNACFGPTGLQPGETDISEDAGCADSDDNNFLAPVNLVKDNVYALCIQNFTTENGFRVEFCGTALLGCETDTCASIVSTVQTPGQPAFRLHALYPTPVSNGLFTLDLEAEKGELMEFNLVNTLGQSVREIQRFIPPGRQTYEFPADQLSAGLYWLRITNGRAVTTRPVAVE